MQWKRMEIQQKKETTGDRTKKMKLGMSHLGKLW